MVGELQERRAAVDELGRALRELVQNAVATEVETAELRRVAALAREAAAALGRVSRSRHESSSVDDIMAGVRMYNPVIGRGSPFAPPLDITVIDGRAEAACALGLAYEGPPTYAHGGVSAMLLDQMLGHAVAFSGRPGMTRELVCRYHRPVPLQTPLVLVAQVLEADEEGRRVVGTATIATADDPSTVLVEATGTFVWLRAEHVQRLYARNGDSAR
jgi:acyl-coenzyme A thioesterase PaaI-like protein